MIYADGVIPVLYVSADSELRDTLWEFGTMDDCDYVLLVPRSEMAEIHDDTDDITYEPRSYFVERMLRSFCDTFWTVGTIDGTEYGIGYAYHA